MAISGQDLMNAYKDQYGVINVKQYGAKGDGVQDDTAAFIAAKKEVMRLVTNFSSENGQRRGNAVLYIPPGTYLIKSGKALMDDTMTSSAMGYSVQGAGRMITRIVFDPNPAGQYLFYNRDGWNQIHVSDIEFQSRNGANNLFYSYSSGRSHGMEFERIHVGGQWNYGFHLEGTNTDSEILWYKCGFSGEWNKVFYIPATASDQMVNYDFISCQFEVAKGDFIDVQKGGSINVIGGSLLYYPGTTVGGTMFKLGVGGGDHNSGAMRFLCMGARVELAKSVCRMLQSEWKAGIITFQNVDNSVQAYQADKNWVNVSINSQGDAFPNVVFDNCVLQGRHEYRYSGGGAQRLETIAYRSCSIAQHNTPDAFISLVNTSGTAPAAVPQISFRNCSGTGSTTMYKNLFDTELNWSNTTSGRAEKKVLSINTAGNTLPYNRAATEDVYLPLGAVITKVTVFMAPNTTSSTASGWSYTVRTSEATPTVLATATPSNGAPRNGFNTQKDVFFICDTEEKRHIVLAASSAVTEARKGYCLIEYIG
ncbi:glycosyl hydrolase family 28-related protein [Cohnella candidum]|nr:glycosyl hydrolase family 28-related protein [Cohnella candidum]